MTGPMGSYSEVIFGRKRLPARALLCAGVYTPQRKNLVRKSFRGWDRVKGNWIKYAFGNVLGKDFLVIFGIYGAAMTLETVQLLRDGGVRSLFFVGSMYAKKLPVGSIAIPIEAQDNAGVMTLDDPTTTHAIPDRRILDYTRSELRRRDIDFTEGRVSSVPAVLHGIVHIVDSVRQDERVIGHEMEVSTFLHFTRKHSMRAGALLYVSDNERHSIISSAKGPTTARRKALRAVSSVAVSVLRHF